MGEMEMSEVRVRGWLESDVTRKGAGKSRARNSTDVLNCVHVGSTIPDRCSTNYHRLLYHVCLVSQNALEKVCIFLE